MGQFLVAEIEEKIDEETIMKINELTFFIVFSLLCLAMCGLARLLVE